MYSSPITASTLPSRRNTHSCRIAASHHTPPGSNRQIRSSRIIGRRVGRSLSFGLPWKPSGPSWLCGEFGGGTADKLDLRPLDSYDVSFFATDRDGNAANGNESLRIVINDTNSVTVIGHFSPISQAQENGRMEQIIFSNEVVTNAAQLNALM